MSHLIGERAPWFGGKCCLKGEFIDVSLDALAGSWVLLFFYPLDFDHIAPGEMLELERLRPQLEAIGCRIVAVAPGSVQAHARFGQTAPKDGGVAGINFPVMEDPAGVICRAYGVLMPQVGYNVLERVFLGILYYLVCVLQYFVEMKRICFFRKICKIYRSDISFPERFALRECFCENFSQWKNFAKIMAFV